LEISNVAASATSVTALVSTSTSRRRCFRSDQRIFLLSGDQIGWYL